MKYVSWLTPQITVHYLSSYPIEILPSEFGQSESKVDGPKECKSTVLKVDARAKLDGLETERS